MKLRELLVAAALVFTALPAVAEEGKAEASSKESGSDATPQVAADGSIQRGNANSPWRGSALSYEHVVSTISLDKGAELTYNPYYAHSLAIAPRYYLRDDLYVAALWTVEQELTDSDWTTRKHEPIWSDLMLDLGWSGFAEPTTGIRLSGSLRLALPLSKLSQAQTQILSVAPTVRLSRTFPILNGLTVGWNTRYTQRFHEETSGRSEESGIVGCTRECDALRNLGLINAWGDISTGPSVFLMVTDRLSFSGDMRWGKSWIYDSAETIDPITGEVIQGRSDLSGRYSTLFLLSAGYELMDELTLSGGVVTASPQLKPDSTRRSPFFNRFTQVFVDLQVNLSALTGI